MVLNATEGALIRIGCEVVSFVDPSLALEEYRLRTDHYDILVTDQVMPVLSGLQLIEAVKAIQPIPAILCTGNAEVSQLQGISGVSLLRKPYTQAQLATLVASVILAGQGDTLPVEGAKINRS
jgi:CheY-like chemotaxis protein